MFDERKKIDQFKYITGFFNKTTWFPQVLFDMHLHRTLGEAASYLT